MPRAIAKFIPTTNPIAKECKLKEVKNAGPDSRIQILKGVISSLANKGRISFSQNV